MSPPGALDSPVTPRRRGAPPICSIRFLQGSGGNRVDHLQGLGERGGAVGEGRELLRAWPHFLGWRT